MRPEAQKPLPGQRRKRIPKRNSKVALCCTVRRPAINERLATIAAGEGPALLRETDDRERPLETFAVGIRWDRYTQEDLLEIVEVRRRDLRFAARRSALLCFLQILSKYTVVPSNSALARKRLLLS